MKKIEDIRTNYKLGFLEQSNLVYSPIIQCKKWLNEVIGQVLEPTAMTLSTHTNKHGTRSRVVLLKEIKRDGFVFYTNYDSLKGMQIESNKNVSLSFFWPKFQRQICINGLAVKISNKESINYFRKKEE